MSDKRAQNSNAEGMGSPMQWDASGQYTSGYHPSASQYAASHSYSSSAPRGHHSIPHHDPVGVPAYPLTNQAGYPVSSRQQYADVPRSDRTMHPSLQSHPSYGRDHHQVIPGQQSLGRPPSYGHTAHAHSLSTAHPYSPPSSSPPEHSMAMQHATPSHYADQMALAQSAATSQYPASPLRPFPCDMCPLSFNRQHDLKRHRDTHTGEKPFLCNGGCGKTFTRKDALKRHQLVKRCGIDEST